MRLLLPFLLLLSTAAPLLSAPDSQNAAPLYREAGKDLRPLSKEEKSFLSKTVGYKSNATPSPISEEEATALLEAYAAPLDTIRKANSFAHHDWEHDYSRGMLIGYTIYGELFTYAQLLALQLRLEIAQENFPAAEETLHQILTLRTRIAAEKPLLIEMIIQVSVNSCLIPALANDLSKWPEATLPRLAELLSRPSHATFSSVVETESDIFTRFIETHATPERVKLTGDNLEQLRAMLAAYRADLPRLQALITLPPAEALPQAQAFEKELREREAANPLLISNIASLVGTIENLTYNDTRIAMLQTAIAIRQHGPEVVGKSRDPYNSKPFTYEKTEDGFTLTSELIEKEKPLSLTFR